MMTDRFGDRRFRGLVIGEFVFGQQEMTTVASKNHFLTTNEDLPVAPFDLFAFFIFERREKFWASATVVPGQFDGRQFGPGRVFIFDDVRPSLTSCSRISSLSVLVDGFVNGAFINVFPQLKGLFLSGLIPRRMDHRHHGCRLFAGRTR